MKRVSFFPGLIVCVGILLSLAASSVRAQTASSGSVTGQVSDPQGSSVPGADVTLTEIATTSKQSATTNDSGRYTFPVVNPGLYDITVSKSGFKVSKMAQQKVSIGLVLTVNVTLEVGSVTETVVVTSSSIGSELQTANATIGNTINLKQLELLPNLGRDATSLLSLQPGVTPRGDIAGSYMDQNTFTIDGGNNTDDMAGNTIGYIQNFTGLAGSQTNGMASGVVATPIETVEEFKVSTFGQTSDFNQSSGAQVQMVTRRGTDQWHGSGYGYYYATNHGAANSWLANHTQFNKGIPPTDPSSSTGLRLCSAGTTLASGDNNCQLLYSPIIPNHRSRFGFTAGGPIIPKKILGGKTYLFFGYEGFRFPGSGLFEKQSPSIALRAGVIQVPDSSGVFQPYNLNPGPVTTVIGSAAAGNLRTVTLPGTGSTLDPRGLGISPTIQSVWSRIPLGSDPLCGFCNSSSSIINDGYNVLGFLSTIRTPLTSNNYVWRLDHDFNAKNRFFGSFRAFKLLNVTTNQVDVGGYFGDTAGQYTPKAPRPQLGELMVIGLTSNVSSRITNDLRLSYLWNWWQWSTQNDPPQLGGLGGALEIAPAGTTSTFESTSALIPYNVNNQSTRQRVWDGQDKMLRDDLTWVKGNHLFQFGGQLQNNFNYHTRTDNGSTINNQVVYGIGQGNISFTACGAGNTSSCIPTAAASNASNYQNLAASVLGLVAQTQVIYTRTGSSLQIQPIGTLAQELSTIKYYSGYFADTWRMKPSLTVSYGLSYMYETPPVEANGAQVELVDSSGALVHTDQFLAARKAAALAGQAYAPILGFETTGNLHIKYPYTPFKGGFSPRVSVAWNPNYRSGLRGKLFGEGQTVLRGGYGRTWGRINGVNQVLVPLLGPGLLQPVTCSFTRSDGTCNGGLSPSNSLFNAFRIGPDGLIAPLQAASTTLPQPFFPGALQTGTTAIPCPAGSLLCNAVAGDSTVLDPDYKPEKVDTWDFTIQRQISRKISFEAGYMGKRASNIFEEINLDAVPYMMTLGGQTFAKAFANVWSALCSPGGGGRCTQFDVLGRAAAIAAVPNQPFFEAALGGTGSSFCGATSCTQALLNSTSVINSTGSTNLFGQTRVSDLWSFLNGRSSWTLGRTMLGSQATAINTTTSLGYSNYHAAFFTLKMNDWHGLTSISNFTWGKALGTAQIAQYNSSNQWLDIWNPKASYGPQVFDIKYIFTSGWSYKPTFFKGRHGWQGKLLDGWSVSPFFTAQSGFPIGIGYTEGGNCNAACQGFGEMGNVASSGSAFESAIPISPFIGGHSAHFGVPGSAATLPGFTQNVATSNGPQVGGTGVNIFADPASVWANFRRCVLGIDTSCGGVGNLRGLNRWNVDATVAKDFKFTERVGATFTVQFTNVFNHYQPSDPSSLSLTSATNFGRITNAVYAARQMEIGLRIHF